jgi:hypothetical protein
MRSLIAVLFAAALAAQTMSIEEYEPKSTLVVPQHVLTRARYPFIDVHNHQYGLTPEKVDKLVADMDGITFSKIATKTASWCSPIWIFRISMHRITGGAQRLSSNRTRVRARRV